MVRVKCFKLPSSRQQTENNIIFYAIPLVIDSRRLFSVGGIEYRPDTSVVNELMRLTRREPAGCDKNPFIRFFFTESIARNELNLISIDRF